MKANKKSRALAAMLAAVFVLSLSMPAAVSAEDYGAWIETGSIGVNLVYQGEKGSEVISGRDYVGDGKYDEQIGSLYPGNDPGLTVEAGVSYPLNLAVRNSGDIDHYARVEIHRYFIDPDSGKMTDAISPDKIRLEFAEPQAGTFLDDADSRTVKRTVLYYDRFIPVGEEREFLSGIEIDRSAVVPRVVRKEAVQTENGNRVVTFSKTEKIKPCVEVKIDAVQDHNAADAILSSWGRRVTVDRDGVISLA